MAGRPPTRKLRTPKHGEITIKCGPGPVCEAASKAASEAIAAILQSENLSGKDRNCIDCQAKAVHPKLLNP